MFITIEGIDGSGKTTLAHRLHQWLQQNGRKVYQPVYEPGITKLGDNVRYIVKHGAVPLTPLAETLLFIAARAQFVQEVVLPLLADDWIVICDRFIDSTVAYQGYGHGVDINVIHLLNEIATGGLLPDLTLLVQVPLEKAFKRMDQDDRIERNGTAFYERVARGYADFANSAKSAQRVVTLNGNLAFDDVLLEAQSHVALKIAEWDKRTSEGGRVIQRTPQMADYSDRRPLHYGLYGDADEREIRQRGRASQPPIIADDPIRRREESVHMFDPEVKIRFGMADATTSMEETLDAIRKRMDDIGATKLRLKFSHEEEPGDGFTTLTAKIEPRLVMRTPEMKPSRIDDLTPPPFPEFKKPINPEDEGDGA